MIPSGVASVAEGAVRGAIWNVATTVGTRVAGLVGTLLITRFVAPRDFGEVGAASVCVGTAMMFTHFRYGNYLIAKDASPAENYNANVVHIGLGSSPPPSSSRSRIRSRCSSSRRTA